MKKEKRVRVHPLVHVILKTYAAKEGLTIEKLLEKIVGKYFNIVIK